MSDFRVAGWSALSYGQAGSQVVAQNNCGGDIVAGGALSRFTALTVRTALHGGVFRRFPGGQTLIGHLDGQA